jgi:hypothetical protein
MENTELYKSMVDLIDQTIAEIEELKKSDRFQAAEIKIEGPGEGIAGKPAQGDLEAKKAEEEAKEKEAEEEKKKKEEEAKKAEMEKGINEEEAKKAEMEKGINEEKPVKKEEDEEEEEDEDEEEEEAKKSDVEINDLMKSMIDERVKPIETKIDSILNLIKELADTPVSPKSVSYKDIAPLKKSIDEEQPLNKTDVASKLFELKKSGVKVDTMDITQAELADPATLQKIVTKYNIK